MKFIVPCWLVWFLFVIPALEDFVTVICPLFDKFVFPVDELCGDIFGKIFLYCGPVFFGGAGLVCKGTSITG